MLSFFLILIASVFFTGIILRTKSICSGRKGPAITQPLHNVWLLLRKGSVFSETSGWIQQVTPVILLASLLIAALILPFNGHKTIFSFSYDFIFFIYLMALGRFFVIISALDAGSSFQGMGAAREALYSMLAEPAFFIILASFCLITGYSSFNDIFMNIGGSDSKYLIATMLAIFVFANLALIDNSRMPVDDPKTHLELTMIHEVMVLDYSGFDLALVNISSFLKFSIYGTLIANCIIPVTWSFFCQIVGYFSIQVLFAMSIGIVESFRARNRLNKNAQYILAISAIALVSFVLTMFLSNK